MKQYMIYTFQPALVFIFVMCLISFSLILLSDMFSVNIPDINKRAPYECGYKPLTNDIGIFDIKYYVVALLFLIFDVETIFLIPFVTVINFNNSFIFNNFILFTFLLFLGIFYEWKNKFFDWE